MTIYQNNALNLTAMIVPDLAVVIQPPDVSQLNGVPTNIVGIVGTAQWGPVNSPVVFGGMGDGSRQFGSIQARKYDLMTVAAAAVLQGANNFRGVRVTDGTDAAATIAVLTNCITFTSKYTGSLANADQVAVGPGSAPSSFKATVLRAGRAPEVFDNLTGSGNALWVAMANAINLGQSGVRGPSELIVATAGVGVTAPSTATYTLTGGADGAGSIVPATHLVGADTQGARTGMYALRTTGASIGVLADCDVSATWTNQVAFGLSEGVYMLLVAASGVAISNGSTGAVDLLATAAIDSYAFKLLHGDWCYFNDTVNNQIRLISPQGFAAGRLANLSPDQSGLNKPIYGIVGTQRSYANQVYSAAELQALGSGRVDVITAPSVGGSYFSLRFGRNGSSRADIHGDNYTRMTNYIAATLNAGMGQYIGQNQTPTVRRNAKATLDDFCYRMAFAGMISAAGGGDPWSVQLDEPTAQNTNNPAQNVAAGIMRADCRISYASVIEIFLVNMQGGQTVTVTRLQT